MNDVSAQTENVPALAEAARVNLPATYESAKQAIARCEELDECKGWTDKAAALAAYARMRDDDDMRVTAVKIQERANRRYGILFNQLHPRRDGATRFGNAAPDIPVKTRIEAARETGTSPRQLHTALRIAAIPEPEFERQVESPNPPSVRELADQGTTHRVPVSEERAAGLVRGPELTVACKALFSFANFCKEHDAATIGKSIDAGDVITVRNLVARSRQWLEELAVHLPQEW